MTWHPCGARFWGPVLFEERVGVRRTGCSFVVSRIRYWQICLLTWGAKVPALGLLAALLRGRIQVTYSVRTRGQA